GEHRTWTERELLLALVEHRDAENVRGQQIGRELHAREARADRCGERLGERGLAGARRVLDQHVPAAGKGGEEFAHGAVLAVYDALDVSGDARGETLRFPGIQG